MKGIRLNRKPFVR